MGLEYRVLTLSLRFLTCGWIRGWIVTTYSPLCGAVSLQYKSTIIMIYFNLDELMRSPTAARIGMANTADASVTANLKALVDNILDPLRMRWGGPITVNSGYRSPRLNAAVGGVPSSQHTTGHAADISVGSRRGNKELFQLIIRLNLPFDQLIFESGSLSQGPDWVHVSYDSSRNRRQVLYLTKKR